MTSILFSVFFLVSAGDPPTEVASQPAQATTTTAPAAEPKMICKYEHVTGSRLSKQKVCRPEGAAGDDQSTALQREMDKFGSRPERAPGLGN